MLPRLLPALAGLAATVRAQDPPPASYTLPQPVACATCVTWQGLGALAGGGSAKLFRDYSDDAQRERMLEMLFLPSFGASLQILGVEIGGDGNAGWGAESAYVHGAADPPQVQRGSQLWLAAAARRLNPAIVLYAVPTTWPGFLRRDPSAKDPFGTTRDEAIDVATWTVNWLIEAKRVYGISFDYCGVWNYPDHSFGLNGPGQQYYVEALAEALSDERANLPTKILCSDQDWSCASVMRSNPDSFRNLVAVIGAHGPSPSADAVFERDSPAQAAHPLWSTDLGDVGVANTASALRLGSMIANASVFGGLAGVLAVPLVSGSPYLFPRWNEGILQTSFPWSGYYYATVFTWVLAHTTHFVKPGWSIAPQNTGLAGDNSGLLALGGTYVYAFDPAGIDFSLVIAKFSAGQGDRADPETATFVLYGGATNPWAGASLTVVMSLYKFDVGALGGPGNMTSFERSTIICDASGAFTLPLWKHAHVTVTSLGNTAATKGEYEAPPAPTAFPATWASDFSVDSGECVLNGPARFFFDINGAFECAWNAALGSDVLQQVATAAPVSRYSDTRPHTVFGDPQWQDVDLTVQLLLPLATDTAMVGVRLTSWNSSANIVTMNNLPGLWVLVNTTGWAVIHDLNDASLARPYFSRAHPQPLSVATWHSVRLLAHGDALVVTIDNVLAGRVACGYETHSPTAGFVGLGTAAFGSFVQFNRVEVSALKSACSSTAQAGQQVFVDQCAAGSPGMTFSFAVSADRAPAGQFIYAARPGLCIEQDAPGSPTKFLTLQPCNASEPRQLWEVERDISDGPFLVGPVVSAADGGVLDLYYSNYNDDAPVDTYFWEEQSNQVVYFDAAAGLLHFIQYGVCIGACERL